MIAAMNTKCAESPSIICNNCITYWGVIIKPCKKFFRAPIIIGSFPFTIGPYNFWMITINEFFKLGNYLKIIRICTCDVCKYSLFYLLMKIYVLNSFYGTRTSDFFTKLKSFARERFDPRVPVILTVK